MSDREVADVDKLLQTSPRIATGTRASSLLASVYVWENPSFELETRWWCVLYSPEHRPSIHGYLIP